MGGAVMLKKLAIGLVLVSFLAACAGDASPPSDTPIETAKSSAETTQDFLRGEAAYTSGTYTKNYVFENNLGRTVTPLPDGVWHKVHEEREDFDEGSGDYVSNTKMKNTYLIKLENFLNNNVSGIVYIRTNTDFHGADGIEPSPFCYLENWKHIKQESVFTRNTFCWGVRNLRFSKEPRQGTLWKRALKAIDKAGWFAPLGLRATQATYVRSDSDKLLHVSYFFSRSDRMNWMEARDWLKGLKPRIQAGFQGKYLTPPRQLTTNSTP
jgi:hypothetical protein